MMNKKIKWLTGLIFASLFTSANASVVSVYNWSNVDGVDTGTTLFQVTETFTSAAELGGSNNLYQFSIENLSDYTATLFRVANPDNLSRTMTGPTSWADRGTQNFLWETSTPSDYLLPGGTLSGFEISTPGLIPDLTFANYGYNGAGWIMATDATGARFDIFGELNAVPIPSAVWLFGSGLIGLVGIARKKKS